MTTVDAGSRGDRAVTLTGPTIHTSGTASVTLRRGAGPITFVVNGVAIPALVENVVSTDRTTTLAAGGASVSLVEHLLAALHMAGFHAGVHVEVDGPELPILDGSAQPWLEAVACLGTPPPQPEALRLTQALEVRVGESLARAEPGPLTLSCSIDFDHPAIGAQTWEGGRHAFTDLAAARTFGLMADAQVLRSRGLALGAVLEHAIVFADDGPMSPLRFADEPVRHKALDAVGDLTLLGRPLDAAVRIVRGSHTLHVALVKALSGAVSLPGTGARS